MVNELRLIYGLLGFMAGFLLSNSCNKPGPQYTEGRRDTIIQKDTTIYNTEQGKNNFYYYPESIPQKLSSQDSFEIFRQMAFKTAVLDSFRVLDTLGRLIASGSILDTLYANRILYRNIKTRIDRPSIYAIQNFEPVPGEKLRAFSLGTSFETSLNDVSGTIYLNGLYQNKRGTGFFGGYGTGKKIQFGIIQTVFRTK